jgi:ferredoxin, 2Fe-2S
MPVLRLSWLAMVKIVIENLAKKEVPVKDFTRPVIFQIHAGLVDWMHACGMKGRCTTCKMIILEGMENLTPLSDAELKYRNLGALGDGERLACQAMTSGDLRIMVPDECKLPHLIYST